MRGEEMNKIGLEERGGERRKKRQRKERNREKKAGCRKKRKKERKKEREGCKEYKVVPDETEWHACEHDEHETSSAARLWVKRK